MGVKYHCAYCGQDDPFQIFALPGSATEFVCDICIDSARPARAETPAQQEVTSNNQAAANKQAEAEKPSFVTPKPSATLSARIQELIDGLDPDPVKSSATFAFKNYHNALPLHYHALYFWAIKPDGTMLCKDLDSSSSPEVETNPAQIREVLENGAAHHPELRELL